MQSEICTNVSGSVYGVQFMSKEIDMLQSKKIREIVFSRNRNGSIIAFGMENSLKISKR